MSLPNEHQEHEEDKIAARGIYLLPNLLTTAALFAGFYSIVAGMKGYFDTAAIAIFVAMIADGLDGRVARLTNTQTPFGAQYDSLSDMVAFGVAPSLVYYSWSLHYLGKPGWLLAFLYTAATALRLARFNIQAPDKHYFFGLTSTSGAGVMASTIWLSFSLSSYGLTGLNMSLPLGLLTVIVAGLMDSTIPYSSFKSVDFKGRVPFFKIVLAVCILVAIALQPPLVLFAVFMLYMLSGPVMLVWRWLQMRRAKKQSKK